MGNALWAESDRIKGGCGRWEEHTGKGTEVVEARSPREGTEVSARALIRHAAEHVI